MDSDSQGRMDWETLKGSVGDPSEWRLGKGRVATGKDKEVEWVSLEEVQKSVEDERSKEDCLERTVLSSKRMFIW